MPPGWLGSVFRTGASRGLKRSRLRRHALLVPPLRSGTSAPPRVAHALPPSRDRCALAPLALDCGALGAVWAGGTAGTSPAPPIGGAERPAWRPSWTGAASKSSTLSTDWTSWWSVGRATSARYVDSRGWTRSASRRRHRGHRAARHSGFVRLPLDSPRGRPRGAGPVEREDLRVERGGPRLAGLFACRATRVCAVTRH